MINSITITHEVQFSETDMAGIVHFSNFFKWMEEAESAFFQKLNLKLADITPQRAAGWPRVDVSCTFKRPARFQDRIAVELNVSEIRNHSIVYSFNFYHIVHDTQKPRLIAEGKMTTVYATFDIVSGTIKPRLIEDQLRACLSTPTINKPAELNPASTY